MCFSYWNDKRSAHLALRNLVVTCMLVLGRMHATQCLVLDNLTTVLLEGLSFPVRSASTSPRASCSCWHLGYSFPAMPPTRRQNWGSFSASIHSAVVCRNQGISRLELKGFHYIDLVALVESRRHGIGHLPIVSPEPFPVKNHPFITPFTAMITSKGLFKDPGSS